MLNKINFSIKDFKNIRFFFYKQNKFILVKPFFRDEVLFFVPHFVFFELIDDNAVFFLKDLTFLRDYNTFLSTFFSHTSSSLIKKKLYVKGLGFRLSYDYTIKQLELKLGFSHIIRVDVPPYISSINVLKNCLIVECVDKALLGNFICTIRNLKSPDSYKGKGFFFKYQKDRLKTVKKK